MISFYDNLIYIYNMPLRDPQRHAPTALDPCPRTGTAALALTLRKRKGKEAFHFISFHWKVLSWLLSFEWKWVGSVMLTCWQDVLLQLLWRQRLGPRVTSHLDLSRLVTWMPGKLRHASMTRTASFRTSCSLSSQLFASLNSWKLL